MEFYSTAQVLDFMLLLACVFKKISSQKYIRCLWNIMEYLHLTVKLCLL